MIRSALRTALALRLKMPESGDPLLPDATLNDIIRQSLNDFSREFDWPWLLTSASLTFSTTTGLAPLPAGFVRPRELMIGGTATTRKRARYSRLAEYLDFKAIGGYRVWTVLGTNVELSIIPTTVPSALLYYVQQEPALASDAAAPLLPEAYQDAMLARAAYHAEIRRGRPEASMVHDNEFQLEMKKMRKHEFAASGPRRVTVASSNWASW